MDSRAKAGASSFKLGVGPMHVIGLLMLALGVLAFSLISRPLTQSFVTPPMAFAAFGLAMGEAGLGWFDLDLDHGFIHVIAEFTLVINLFSDASRIRLGALARDHDIPVRLLTIALPLTVFAGGAAALGLFPGLSIWSALLLAAILAPTDAALGQAVVSSPKVPVKIRQALNIESGLNDGLALPAVLFLAACASMHGGGDDSPIAWLQFAVVQIFVGGAIGIGAGFLAGTVMCYCVGRGWLAEGFKGIGSLAIALAAFAAAEQLGGNGFIAAFAAGLIYGNMGHKHAESLLRFSETEGQLLTLITFFVFGAVILPEAAPHADMLTFVYAALSLTVVRMLPTALALTGLRLRGASIAFLGWFGPRGLASILFVLLIAEEPGLADYELIFNVTAITVALSIILHGLTANAGAAAYAARLAALRQRDMCRAELEPVAEMPHGVGVARGRASSSTAQPIQGAKA
ncbi:MAG: cation:proton antiporter [Pseudomonadota bacterium]